MARSVAVTTVKMSAASGRRSFVWVFRFRHEASEVKHG